MSRPGASEEPQPEIEDPRRRALVALIHREEEDERFEDERGRD
jgi:hypothetical protein